MAGRNVLDPYRRALDSFDSVLSRVPADGWDGPSMCELWTVRDVAGHVIWGQNQLAHWATGQDYDCTNGAPGAAHPAEMAGTDPLATWRTARAAADKTLTSDALAATVTLPGLGETPLSGIVTLLVTDLLAHGWDIGHPLDLEMRLEPDLVSGSFAWARDHVIRVPGFFGPELTPPADTDEQTRWLAYLGRRGWAPAHA
jgi:uncharacterized protein (TIGR03086 family)